MTNSTEVSPKIVNSSDIDQRSDISPSTINDTEDISGSVQDLVVGSDDDADDHVHINKIDLINNSRFMANETFNYSQSTMTTTTETTTNLYKMKSLAARNGRLSPEKIEFKLYKKSKQSLRKSRNGRNVKINSKIRKVSPSKVKTKKTNKKQINQKKYNRKEGINKTENINKIPFVKRLCNSLSKMVSRTPEVSPTKFERKFKESKISETNNNNSNNGNDDVQKKDNHGNHSPFLKMNSKPIDRDRIDIYYFDHGNSTYFRTTDCPPVILSEILAQQTTYHATRFWAEIFGAIHIGVTFFLTFFLQAYRFILHSILRPIIVGILQITSDYFLKPILTIMFNGFIQPPLILFYNIFSSLRDMLEPIALIIDNFLSPISKVFKSVRFINFNYTNRKQIKENV